MLLMTTMMAMFSCGSDSGMIEFSGTSFNLPLSVEEAGKIFGIDHIDTKGSYRSGPIEARRILAHPLSKQALKGDDFSIGPQHYKQTLVGITFYEKCRSREELEKLHAKYYAELENKYVGQFKEIQFSFFTSLTGNYYYIPLEKELILVLGDVMYNRADNNYVTISFFKGIELKDLTTYLNSIY